MRFRNAKVMRASKIHREITAVYVSGIDALSLRLWCQTCNSGRAKIISMMKKKSGRRSVITDDLIQSVDELNKTKNVV